jgi:flagellar secretion chaperone FliS
MTPTNPHHEYLASRVAAATPVELTRMLFEGAVKAVEEAIEAYGAGDILARGNAVTKAVQILGELRFSLRRDVAPQYCDTLSGLYGYLQNRLIQAHAEKSESMLREVLKLIQALLDGWVGAMSNLNAAEAASPAEARAPEPEPVGADSAHPYSSPYPTAAAPAAESLNRSWEF